MLDISVATEAQWGHVPLIELVKQNKEKENPRKERKEKKRL